MKIKIKLQEGAQVPTRGTADSAGMDLYATGVDVAIMTGIVTYKTGVHVQIPKGYVGLIFPRSSISKTPFVLKNSVGVIDSDYRGEIMVKFQKIENSGNKSIPYSLGERIAQLVILPYPQVEWEHVEELDATERGDGGFGSTGK